MTDTQNAIEVANRAISLLEALTSSVLDTVASRSVVAELRNELRRVTASVGPVPEREPGTEFTAPIPAATLKRMRDCAALLPEPGNEVAIHLLDHIAWSVRHAPVDPVIVIGDAVAAAALGSAPAIANVVARTFQGRIGISRETLALKFGMSVISGLGLGMLLGPQP